MTNPVIIAIIVIILIVVFILCYNYLTYGYTLNFNNVLSPNNMEDELTPYSLVLPGIDNIDLNPEDGTISLFYNTEDGKLMVTTDEFTSFDICKSDDDQSTTISSGSAANVLIPTGLPPSTIGNIYFNTNDNMIYYYNGDKDNTGLSLFRSLKTWKTDSGIQPTTPTTLAVKMTTIDQTKADPIGDNKLVVGSFVVDTEKHHTYIVVAKPRANKDDPLVPKLRKLW